MRSFLGLGVVLWLCATGAGLWTVWAYDNRPGAAATPPVEWATDDLRLAADRPTLVLLAHPQCSCTRATLTELAEALARATTLPQTYVLFLKPQGFPEGWEDTALWHTAANLPATTVMRDDNGTQARRFGAETSGQVVLYAADGTLLFSGGITSARGHAGENEGRASLVALLNRSATTARGTAVFGCPLFQERAAS